ncbi:Paraquat-inducible protein A [Reichenbachiella agariperforans]|uniref:Paraquat-inducible protein A n=1 Tax=Reichenbachiella agariperforans TaxID=156994 RepID=A0A1M6L1W0_REIAG|nr:paraquat-inducible protein A [Reichenbachiella agariperforans]SHJ65177.1 Paraquat-inducible protein A [Reichenbachiella agariperforans]
MLARNIVALFLTIVSLVILYPGLTFPMLNITVSTELPILGKTYFLDQSQSVLQTIDTLYSSNNRFVAMLILLFSIVVPIVKGVVVVSVLLVKQFGLKIKLFKLVHAIGKWSMADVFVVGVFMAFLSSQSNGFIEAELLSGFFYFSTYCLLSLLAIQLVKLPLGEPK